MTTIFNLRAATNATFHWTRDLSQIAAVYAVASGVIRMQARIHARRSRSPGLSMGDGRQFGRRHHLRPGQ